MFDRRPQQRLKAHKVLCRTKGMIEHTSAAHKQVESAHSPLAIDLRVRD
jgi:hypothetical protein